MAYAHIENLYRNQDILMFKECYALEKIHGTSAHVAWRDGGLSFFSGGVNHDAFVRLFDIEALSAILVGMEIGKTSVTVYGEAYGGKCQGMSATYGKDLKFVAFDVKVGDVFLSIPNAADVATKLGLEFVDYRRVSTDLAVLDAERDRPSEQAFRNGVADRDNDGTWKIREGVVLRPLVEVCRAGRENGRIVAKHKRPEFSERKTVPPVDQAKRQVMEDAERIASEWVTPMRLEHVLDHIGNPTDMAATGAVIAAMIEDVEREAKGEIAESAEARKAIGKATARMFKERITRMPA